MGAPSPNIRSATGTGQAVEGDLGWLEPTTTYHHLQSLPTLLLLPLPPRAACSINYNNDSINNGNNNSNNNNNNNSNNSNNNSNININTNNNQLPLRSAPAGHQVCAPPVVPAACTAPQIFPGPLEDSAAAAAAAGCLLAAFLEAEDEELLVPPPSLAVVARMGQSWQLPAGRPNSQLDNSKTAVLPREALEELQRISAEMEANSLLQATWADRVDRAARAALHEAICVAGAARALAAHAQRASSESAEDQRTAKEVATLLLGLRELERRASVSEPGNFSGPQAQSLREWLPACSSVDDCWRWAVSTQVHLQGLHAILLRPSQPTALSDSARAHVRASVAATALRLRAALSALPATARTRTTATTITAPSSSQGSEHRVSHSPQGVYGSAVIR
ncbi:unnamed protein product [Polarella glacialis]|uniref:Uncharacterized protein n=1 Tax=Polarella glacialis TaxID=89957 RepID=A0A813L1R9_POLGL|nr:unnamed protein product [Polarella glacialis]